MPTFAKEHCRHPWLLGEFFATVNAKVGRWDFNQPGYQQESQIRQCLVTKHQMERDSQRRYGWRPRVGVHGSELQAAEVAAAVNRKKK